MQIDDPNWSVYIPLGHNWHNCFLVFEKDEVENWSLFLNIPGGQATHITSLLSELWSCLYFWEAWFMFRASHPDWHPPRLCLVWCMGEQSGMKRLTFQSTLCRLHRYVGGRENLENRIWIVLVYDMHEMIIFLQLYLTFDRNHVLNCKSESIFYFLLQSCGRTWLHSQFEEVYHRPCGSVCCYHWEVYCLSCFSLALLLC